MYVNSNFNLLKVNKKVGEREDLGMTSLVPFFC